MRNPFNRFKDLEAINKRRKQVFEELQGFVMDNSLITLETLRSLDMNVWHDMANGAGRFCKVGMTHKSVTFITEMNAGGTFSLHKHNCIETVKVIKGNLIDEENNVNLSKDEEHTYEHLQYHKPYSTIESTYLVVFT